MVLTFLKLEGNTVRNRLWNFLIVHSEFDYSMKDIARLSEISYTALKEIWKEFIKRDIVTHTRDVGKARMYTLNRENPQVEKFINYYWSVIDSNIPKHKEKNQYDEFLHKIQQTKMKELWDNKEDETWEISKLS